jgi:rhodanese-related sulfurtransferase
MPPFPLPLEALIGKTGLYIVFLVIGFFFGFVLEVSGFNHSPTLAAQFYFKDLRVFKVFFTAIATAMVLIFGTSALGLLDYNLIWVNETFLWSGILGGLIMGVGFILGGFCPGTSIVALATLKIDGIFFVLGGFVGAFLFSETVGSFENFYNGSYFGRLTLMDVFGIPAGWLVLMVVLMALGMFWGGEKLEALVAKKAAAGSPTLRKAGAGVLIGAALLVLFIGQPTTADRWQRISAEKEAALANREVQIHPAELLSTMADDRLQTVLLDVRSETDYNLFHIRGAQRISVEVLPALIADLRVRITENTVVVVMGNDEAEAEAVWKYLVAESVPNVYVLEGGVNNWIAVFADESPEISPAADTGEGEVLDYRFPAALGERYEISYPSPHRWGSLEFIPKIELDLKRGPSGGGCG